jgi:hypothetical protein
MVLWCESPVHRSGRVHQGQIPDQGITGTFIGFRELDAG